MKIRLSEFSTVSAALDNINCGEGTYYLVGMGDYAMIQWHPWMAHVTIRNQKQSCGGALIPHRRGSSSFLITAAHCFRRVKRFTHDL